MSNRPHFGDTVCKFLTHAFWPDLTAKRQVVFLRGWVRCQNDRWSVILPYLEWGKCLGHMCYFLKQVLSSTIQPSWFLIPPFRKTAKYCIKKELTDVWITVPESDKLKLEMSAVLEAMQEGAYLGNHLFVKYKGTNKKKALKQIKGDEQSVSNEHLRRCIMRPQRIKHPK